MHSEILKRNIEGYPGIKVGGHNVNNLTYFDETALIRGNKEECKIIRQLKKQKERIGIELQIDSSKGSQSKQ